MKAKYIKEDVDALKKELEDAKNELAEKREDVKKRVIGYIRDAETLEELNVLLNTFREMGETDADIIRNFEAHMPFAEYTGRMYITPEGLLTYDYIVGKFIMYNSPDKPAVVQDEEYVIDEG